MYTETEDC